MNTSVKRYKIGDKVFDMPSQSICTVIDTADRAWPSTEPEEDTIYYLVDAPPDPTGDGVFTDGWRCEFEVCDPDKTLPLFY
jgi:hypothetical protein